jgi:hypothetical protein
LIAPDRIEGTWEGEFALVSSHAPDARSLAEAVLYAVGPAEIADSCLDLAARLGRVARASLRPLAVERVSFGPMLSDSEQDRLRARAIGWGLSTLPTGAAHGDLRPRNVMLRTNGDVALCPPTEAAHDVLAGFDLLTLLTQTTHLMRPAPTTDGAFGVARILRPAILAFEDESGLDEGALRQVAPLFFAAGRARSLLRTELRVRRSPELPEEALPA